MPENEYETARLKRTGQSRLGRGVCACLGREGRRNRKDTDCDGEGSEPGTSLERCAHIRHFGCERQSDPSCATRATLAQGFPTSREGYKFQEGTRSRGKGRLAPSWQTRALIPELASYLWIEPRERGGRAELVVLDGNHKAEHDRAPKCEAAQ
jgi:hypothetical protein